MNRIALALVAALMMGSSLPTLKYRAMSSTGVPLSGAKLYFYKTGTTTPLATYSDEALATPNANPVVSDAYGWFGEIYLKTDEAYRVKLSTSAGVEQWTINNVWAAQLVSDAFQTRIKQIASNPLDYGAVGDGVADESSYVQDAIDAATGTVDLLGKVYRCDSTVTLSSGITLKNGTLDFTNATDTVAVDVAGTIGSAINLSGNTAIGDTSIALDSVAGLAAGDWLLLTDDETYVTSHNPRDLVQILSIAALNVNLTNSLQWAYLIANTARVYKLTPKTGITLDTVTVIRSAAQSNKFNMRLRYATDITIKAGVFDGASGYGLWVDDSADVLVDNSEFTDNKASGVGLVIEGASRDITVRDSRFTEDAGEGIRLKGEIARNINITGTRFAGPVYGIYLYGPSDGVVIDKCDFWGLSTGTYGIGQVTDPGVSNIAILDSHFHRCDVAIDIAPWVPSAVVNNITIRGNRLETGGISVSPQSGNAASTILDIDSNYIDGGITVNVTAGTGVLKQPRIRNNHIADGYIGIFADASPGCTDPLISGNVLIDGDAELISLAFPTRPVVIGNTLDGNAAIDEAIYIYGPPTGLVSIRDNHIRNIVAGSWAINVIGATLLDVTGNSLDVAGGGVFLDGSASTAWTGVTITGNDITVDGNACMELDADSAGCVNVAITGNRLNSTVADNTITFSGNNDLTNVAVVGNTIYKDEDTVPSISLGTSTIDDIAIVGNAFVNGSYAVSNCSGGGVGDVLVIGNVINGMGTADLDGACDNEVAADDHNN